MCLMASEACMPLVEEFLEFWTGNVDPSALSLPHNFLDFMCKSKVLAGKPQTRLAIAFAMYTKEGSQSRTPPVPDVCGLISHNDIASLEKTPFVAELMERTLERLQMQWRPMMEQHTSKCNWQVMTSVRALQILVVRVALGKKLDPVLGPCAVVPGKLTAEKMNELLGFWAKSVDNTFPSLDFAKTTGLSKFQTMAAGPVASDVFAVKNDCGPADAPRTRQPVLTSPAKAANQSAHAPGTHIVVTKRSTLRLPLPSDPDFKKDMPVGTRGRIESADLRAADGFIRVRMDYIHNGQPVSLVDFINPANIAVQGSNAAPVDAGSVPLVPDPVRVAFEKDNKDLGLTLDAVNDWEDLINDHGINANMHFLKARAALALEFVMQQVPVYDSSKLLVLHSVNKMGARRTEVWTLEDFKPGELLFAPYTTEIKDRMYTHLAASHLAYPKKHVPGNKVMALDGRNLGHLSHVHPSQHRAYATGSLFWCITRTQEKSKANLVQQSCEVAMPKISVRVPVSGTVHTTKLAATDVPQVHVLTNLALVKKHTRLVALDDTVVAKARTTEKEEEARKAKEANEAKKPKEENEDAEADASVAVDGRPGCKRRRMG